MIVPDAASSPLILRLFGPFEALVSSQPLQPLRSRKTLWLLALLALKRGREIERSWLAGTLWPESAEPQALTGLRQVLTDLRRVLGGESARLHCPSRHVVSLDLTGADVDLIAFDDAIARGDLPSLEKAISLYCGPFLEGCLEEWAVQERAIREEACLSSLERVALHARSRGDLHRATDLLRRAVSIDPLRESVRRRLMKTLADGGNAAEATLVYRELRTLLHRVTLAEPDPRTTELFRRIRARSRMAPSPRSAQDAPPPPLRIPHPLTPLIGREAETEEVIALLTSSRLLTLVGTGGVGKTRLALRVAESVAEEYPDGVWFVDLSGIDDPGLVASATATTLAVREDPKRSVMETLQSYLVNRALLLILDNCEHLIEACAGLMEALLHECPRVRILATSRRPLGLMGEVAWRTPCLSLPDPTKTTAVDLSRSEAARLLIERAKAAYPPFEPDDQSRASVVRICRRLDGIPLAIELAATHVRSLPLGEIESRLENGFRMRFGGSPAVPARHRTLKATLDWSHDLLNELERRLLRRLSVFAGDFDIDAAQAIGLERGREEYEVVEAMSSLVDQGWVVYQERKGRGRYHLLETVRQYGRERLAELKEEETIGERHRDWYLDLAERTSLELHGPERKHLLDRLEEEHTNLRAALEWTRSRADEGESLLKMTGALSEFWFERGHWSEGIRWVEAALVATKPTSSSARIETLIGASDLARWCGRSAESVARAEESLSLALERRDRRATARSLLAIGENRISSDPKAYQTARSRLEEGLTIGREIGDRWIVAKALNELGTMARVQGEYAKARTDSEESLAIWRTLGNQAGTAYALSNLGRVARNQGDNEQARALFEEALVLLREIDDRDGIAYLLDHLGEIDLDSGNPATARERFGESMVLFRNLGDRHGVAQSLHSQGNAILVAGELATAYAHYKESVTIFRGMDDWRCVARVLLNLGEVALSRNDPAIAASHYREALSLSRDMAIKPSFVKSIEGLAAVALAYGRTSVSGCLFGAAEAYRETHEIPVRSNDRDFVLAHLSEAAMEEETFAAARAEGNRMSASLETIGPRELLAWIDECLP